MASKITWNNKVQLVNDETIPDENKVKASDMNQIKEVINNNADQVDDIANDVSDIKEEQIQQNNRLNSLEEDNTTNKSNIQTNANNISSLNTRVGTNENSISNINTTIGTIQTEQTTQNNKISALETDNTTNKNNIATLQTDSGHTISLDLNTTTYVLTATLKNKQGTTLNTSSIDLPVEQLVVSVSYDENTKELVITLKNGEITRVPLGDLVSGLQTEITSSNKLSSDLVDDTNHTHKFVSAGEKETWNAKYNKPSSGIPKADLTTEVQTSLEKADTALQQHQDISGKEDKSNKVTSIDEESTDIQYPSAKCVYDIQQNQNAKIVKLELENQRLKQTLVTTTGSGENITLNKTAEMEFVVPPLPEGNTVQDGEPTPTVPVEVQVVKGDVEVLVQNKNIANIDYFQENYTIGTNGLPVSSVGQNRVTNTVPINVRAFNNVVVSFKNNTSNTINFIYSLLDANNNLISRVAGNSSGLSTNTSTAEYLYICFYDNVTLQSITEVQVEPNTTQSSYTPHQEQKLPLTLGNIELCKIGDYKDYFYKNSGKWYLHKEIGSFILNGNVSFQKYSSSNSYFTAISRFTNNVPVCPETNNIVAPIICTHFDATYINDIAYNSVQKIGFSYINSKEVWFGLPTSIATNVSEVQNWLNNQINNENPVVVHHALATPTDIEITDTTLISQLEAIYNAISYYEQTNISGTSSGINPLFDVEAYQNTKLLLENALDRLELLEN